MATRTATAPRMAAGPTSPVDLQQATHPMMPLMALVTLISGVRCRGHVPDDLPADEAGQDEDGEVLDELGRAKSPTTMSMTAHSAATSPRREPGATSGSGRPRPRVPGRLGGRSRGGSAPDPVVEPDHSAIMKDQDLRTTSSSRSIRWTSALPMSSSRWTMFEPKNWLAWVGTWSGRCSR